MVALFCLFYFYCVHVHFTVYITYELLIFIPVIQFMNAAANNLLY